MKIILSDTTYSYLYPGGKNTLVLNLYKYLLQANIEVELENWYDPKLKGDIIHLFSLSDYAKIKLLKDKGYKIVFTQLLDFQTNQSAMNKLYHIYKNKLILKYLPQRFNPLFPWKAIKYVDLFIYSHDQDRNTAMNLFGIPKSKTHIVPMALENLNKYGEGMVDHSEKYLVCVASIVKRKNINFLADICKNNDIPIKFIGPSFNENSEYFREFIGKTRNSSIQYLGFISEEEKRKVLQNADGFVLLSLGESGCIAVYEAGATGLPILLSDLPWAKGYEMPTHIFYCNIMNYHKAERDVKNFYLSTKRQSSPTFRVRSWEEIAKMYIDVYYQALNN